MLGIYPRSEDLKKIIEKHGWTLYEGGYVNPLDASEYRSYSWEEMEKMGPADVYEVWHYYVFAPVPGAGQSLLDAYKPSSGFGPALDIADKNDRYHSIMAANEDIALFTRLYFHEECAFVTTPRSVYYLKPDFVAIDYDYLAETFEQYFRIATPEGFGLEGPVDECVNNYTATFNN